MEAIIDLLRAIQMNMLEVAFTGLFIFGIGYLFGNKKVKTLTQQVSGLQKDVLDLNEELLYGVSDTPVIGLKHDNLKPAKLAK